MIVLGIIILLLGVYLVYALLHPEKFFLFLHSHKHIIPGVRVNIDPIQ